MGAGERCATGRGVSCVTRSAESLPYDLGQFALSIVRAQFQERSVLELLRASSHLLAKKVVERSGKTGEHYITQSPAEWRAMLLSAAVIGTPAGNTPA